VMADPEGVSSASSEKLATASGPMREHAELPICRWVSYQLRTELVLRMSVPEPALDIPAVVGVKRRDH